MANNSTNRLITRINQRLIPLIRAARDGNHTEQSLRLKTNCIYSERRIEQELEAIMQHFDQLTCEVIQEDGEKYWVINFPCCGLSLTIDQYLRANLSNMKSFDLDFQLDQPGIRDQLLGCLTGD